jgi:hypothetical protein
MSEIKGFIDRDGDKHDIVTETMLNELLDTKANVSHSHTSRDISLNKIVIKGDADGGFFIDNYSAFNNMAMQANVNGHNMPVLVEYDSKLYVSCMYASYALVNAALAGVIVLLTIGNYVFKAEGEAVGNKHTWYNNGRFQVTETIFLKPEEESSNES